MESSPESWPFGADFRFPHQLPHGSDADRHNGADAVEPVAPVELKPSLTTPRIAVHELVCPCSDWNNSGLWLSQLGIRSFGLLRKSLWRDGEDRYRDLCDDHGYRLETLSWAGGLTGTMGFSFREAVDDVRIAVDEAAAARARTVLVATGGRGSHTARHARRMVCEGLQMILGSAGTPPAVQLAILLGSPRPSPRWTLTPNWDEALDWFDQIGHPRLGLAMPWTSLVRLPVDADFARLAPKLHVVQIPLAPLNLPGTADDTGSNPVAAKLARLMQLGFQGTIEFLPDWYGTAHAAMRHSPLRCRVSLQAWCELLGLTTTPRTGRRPRCW